jgi:trehalose-phosphatase
VPADDPEPTVRALPSALGRWDEIASRIAGRRIAVFLDYDGTLTPIVERPEDAVLPGAARGALERLAARHPVAVLSGRDLDDVRAMVGVEGIVYAGSHGFDVAGPAGLAERRGDEAAPLLDRAEELLRPVERVPGARIERKRYAVAVHVRQVEEDQVPEVEVEVERVAGIVGGLRVTTGKKVLELRPDQPWDKGRALLRLLEVHGGDVVPVFVGDDVTDEDALRAVGPDGIGIVVRGEGDDRPTAASFSLAGAGEVTRFLELLSEVDGDRE